MTMYGLNSSSSERSTSRNGSMSKRLDGFSCVCWERLFFCLLLLLAAVVDVVVEGGV